MSICIGGCCIPYNAIWPLLLLILQPVWGFVSKLLGLDSKKASDSVTVDSEKKVVKKVCDCCIGIPDETRGKSWYLGDYDGSFDKVITSNTPVFVRFTAAWCKPCKAIEPDFNALAKDYAGEGHFMAVDIDEHDEVAAAQGVSSIPHFVAYRNGERIGEFVGASKDKLKEFVRANV